MKIFRILILEDDLLTLSKLIEKLAVLEESWSVEKKTEISIVVLSEYSQVEKYINRDDNLDFDLVLLDRDCKLGGSFHTLNIEKIGIQNIIGISSIPEYNEALSKLGVKTVILKEYDFLEDFSNEVIVAVEEIVAKN